MKEPEIITLYRVAYDFGKGSPVVASCQARRTPNGYRYVSGNRAAMAWFRYLPNNRIGHVAWFSELDAIKGAAELWDYQIASTEAQLERAHEQLIATQRLRQEYLDEH